MEPSRGPSLSILCITKAEPCVLPTLHKIRELADDIDAEFVLGLDGETALATAISEDFGRGHGRMVCVKGQGYLESVLDLVLPACSGEYVLRLDDDESVTSEMAAWLWLRSFRDEPHWRFHRQHLWGSHTTFLANPPLWPDDQTRLSRRIMSGERRTIHAPSPFGKGTLAPFPIRHWKFLIRSREEREAHADRYERIQPGAGSGKFVAFNLPEVAFGDNLDVRPVTETTC